MFIIKVDLFVNFIKQNSSCNSGAFSNSVAHRAVMNGALKTARRLTTGPSQEQLQTC